MARLTILANVSGTHPPLQERSRKTLEDLLDAGSELLSERSFVDVTVQDIVQAANSSAGSFYARFADKHAFLHALEDRMLDEVRGRLQRLESVEPRSQSIETTVRALVPATVLLADEYRGLSRALAVNGRADETLTEKHTAFIHEASAIFARLVDAPGMSTEEVTEEMVTGYFVVRAIIDQRILAGEGRTASSASGMGGDDGDCERLIRIMLAAMNL